MAEGIVRFQNVALGYDGVPVLEGLAFDVNRGDFLALVGPNGCGKSTILKGMAGILEPLRGCISREIDGSPVRFGYVPQRETIEMVFPLTVFQVALMGTYGRVGPGRPVTHAPLCRKRMTGNGPVASGMRRSSSSGFDATRAYSMFSIVVNVPVPGVDG